MTPGDRVLRARAVLVTSQGRRLSESLYVALRYTSWSVDISDAAPCSLVTAARSMKVILGGRLCRGATNLAYFRDLAETARELCTSFSTKSVDKKQAGRRRNARPPMQCMKRASFPRRSSCVAEEASVATTARCAGFGSTIEYAKKTQCSRSSSRCEGEGMRDAPFSLRLAIHNVALLGRSRGKRPRATPSTADATPANRTVRNSCAQSAPSDPSIGVHWERVATDAGRYRLC